MERVCDGIFQVGGGGLTQSGDCMVYALDLGELVLIDCGVGPGWDGIAEQMRGAGIDPARIHTLVLTHAHVDHIGAVAAVVAETGCRVVAHALDAEAIESGDAALTAANWYSVTLPRVTVDQRVTGGRETLEFSKGRIELIHTPGHTPGSMVALVEADGRRVLFGQDIHGPFDTTFRSNVAHWRDSMEAVIGLGADVLCEGHYGIYRGRDSVRGFIEGQLRNQGFQPRG
jgi:glyoxylase-like metal-dependent hydrolase (beta-lactamase superfamily II)